ncbi:hypothetical protein [Streptomyces naphthomycinicus]|uniref:hypothetical protein n=1 Tax=Streptomyces naphthomycinicus TaxID=2872625 RepID=UPI001CEC1E84|nr:hypothetical protein [Streptomyces sp. TML10]
MTVLEDRIAMAESDNERTLDEMFERLCVIADPYQRRCHIYTQPKEGEYEIETTVPFGSGLDLTGTVVGLALRTDEFPRD